MLATVVSNVTQDTMVGEALYSTASMVVITAVGIADSSTNTFVPNESMPSNRAIDRAMIGARTSLKTVAAYTVLFRHPNL